MIEEITIFFQISIFKHDNAINHRHGCILKKINLKLLIKLALVLQELLLYISYKLYRKRYWKSLRNSRLAEAGADLVIISRTKKDLGKSF